MKNTQPDKSKKIFIVAIAFLLIVLILFSILYFNNKVDVEKFNENLYSGNYEKAYKSYSKNENEYTQCLSLYLDTIVYNYNTSVITYEKAVNLVNDLIAVGFYGDKTNYCLEQIQMLQLSKTSFSSANNLFAEKKLLDSKILYLEVTENDNNYQEAQNKIIEIDELLKCNQNDYINAYELYKNNDLDTACIAYQSIIDTGINTYDAENMLAEINNIQASWDVEFIENEYSKNTYPYQAIHQNGYMYITYSQNNTHTIIKYNITSGDLDIFAIARMPGDFVIKDINTVGDYLYFIAGENVGNGKMINNPYNIYRMKNDGTNLQCVAQGDYEYLIAYSDGFYASSYSAGIMKLNKNLEFTEQINEEAAIQMQLINDTLFYSVDAHDKYKMIYSWYSYNGSESTEIRSRSNLRFIAYPSTTLYSYRVRVDYQEKVFLFDLNDESAVQLIWDDFIGIYGLVNNKLVCAKEKRNGKLEYYLLDSADKSLLKYQSRLPEDIITLKNICYENNTMIFSTPSGFLITDSEYNPINRVDLYLQDFGSIELNNEYSYLHDNEYYTNDEVVIIEDDFWYYSNSQYNIRIENRYNDDFDTNLYVAHIRTTNPEYIMVDAPYDDTYINKTRKYADMIARQYDAVFACNSDFFDENFWTGISIKDGIVYRNKIIEDMAAVYPDGRLVCYTADDNITAEDLIAAGVKDTFSFGPILLSDNMYGSNLYGHRLAVANPRTAIGMVEPGHYVVILCDGRQPSSSGLTFRSLADLFETEGCTDAYALDGGQSSAMIFMGNYINTHMNDDNGQYFRPLSEIIYFGTSNQVPEEEPIK